MDLSETELKKLHEPVLTTEVLEALDVEKLVLSNKEVRIIDATLGLGGHTLALIESGANILAIDADKNSLKLAYKFLLSKLKPLGFKGRACPSPENKHRFRGPSFIITKERKNKTANSKLGSKLVLVYGNFRDIADIAYFNNFTYVDGILFDLGVSSYQLLSRQRGFSFQNKDAILDMRIDRNRQVVKASDLLNALNVSQITDLFGVVLSKHESNLLAKKVIKVRKQKKIETVGDLLDVLEYPQKFKGKLHPATLVFMALRMAVNSELNNLEEALPNAFNLIDRGRKLVVISFHSGEDRIAKKFIKENKKAKKDFKLIRPNALEVRKNPRARSAKMRIIEKK